MTSALDDPTGRFGSEERARAYLEELRWPDGVTCPRCGSGRPAPIEARARYECGACGYQFSVTAGTALHDSHLPLWKWLAAVYLVVESQRRVSAKEIQRTLGTSYKTAWAVRKRIVEATGGEDAVAEVRTVQQATALFRRLVGGAARDPIARAQLVAPTPSEPGEYAFRDALLALLEAPSAGVREASE